MFHNDVVKSVSIRIPESLLSELRNVAEYEGRSINSQVVYLIRQCGKISKLKTMNSNSDIGRVALSRVNPKDCVNL